MKKLIFSCVVLVFAFTFASTAALAQRETPTGIQVEKDLELLRRDLRADKKKIIAANVPLTETEATKFWPVYDQYAAEMKVHYDEFYSVIKDYAANQKTLTDAQAADMVKRWSKIQVELAQTRQKYVPLVENVIAGKKAALFFQIDRRLFAPGPLQLVDAQRLFADQGFQAGEPEPGVLLDREYHLARDLHAREPSQARECVQPGQDEG